MRVLIFTVLLVSMLGCATLKAEVCKKADLFCDSGTGSEVEVEDSE